MTQDPVVSVVITTRNEERNIVRCLQSIILQTWKDIEIIVVDNSSTDRTKVISLQFTPHVHDKGPERSAQRNYGIREIATGEYAMFIDADMILSPQLIETCVDQMDHDSLVALHVEEVVLGRGFLAKVRRFERSFYSGTVIDGVRFFRRKDFNQIGGFDEGLPPGPEDWDLDKRFKNVGSLRLLGKSARPMNWDMAEFIESRGVGADNDYCGIYHNEDEQTLRKYLSKKSYYAGSMATYTDKWPGDPDVRKQLGLGYRYFLVFVEDGKWKRCLRHPLLITATLGLRVLVGLTYILRRR